MLLRQQGSEDLQFDSPHVCNRREADESDDPIGHLLWLRILRIDLTERLREGVQQLLYIWLLAVWLGHFFIAKSIAGGATLPLTNVWRNYSKFSLRKFGCIFH